MTGRTHAVRRLRSRGRPRGSRAPGVSRFPLLHGPVLLPALALGLLLVLCVAGSAVADSACPNETLREQQHSTALPDCRAYELVSPPEKNGGEAIAVSARTRSASDGNAVTFASLAAFGDPLGTGVAADYMAMRSSEADPASNGWSTHALTPPQQPLSTRASLVGGDPHYAGEMSADLDAGVFRAWSPLTEDPLVEEAQNLYVRHDLRTPGHGTYQLVTPCPGCEAPLSIISKFFPPVLAGASADYQHIAFESRLKLTPGAPEGSSEKAYQVDEGTLSYTGILPDGSAAEESLPGQAQNFGNSVTQAPDPISADGSRTVFMADPVEGGSGVPGGPLYLRIHGRTTVQLNASERATPEAPQPAEFWGMSRDGSRIFFTTTEALTDDPTPSSGRLYMWAKQATDETQSVTVDATAGTFTLSVEGQTSDPIAFDASAGSVQAALEALPTLGAGNVTVTGGPGDAGGTSPYLVTFTRDLSGVGVEQMVADNSSLIGTTTVRTTRPIHNLKLLNVNTNPSPFINEVEGVIGASDDGHYVYFVARGQIVAGAPDTRGEAGIYSWHEGTVTYVGRGDFPNDKSYLFDGDNTAFPRQSGVTPDGRHLVFDASNGEGLLSVHGGVDYDQGACNSTFFGCQEIYVYSADSNSLACASCNPSGAPASVEAWSRTIAGVGASTIPSAESRVVSDDGRFVFFSTQEALVPQDVNGHWDAYEFDTLSGHVHLLSSGVDPTDSYFMTASPDGRNAFFTSSQQLVGWDQDHAGDLYDARIDGGFPEPAVKVACDGEGCQGSPSHPAGPSPPGSAGFVGAGNPAPPAAANAPAAKRPLTRAQLLKRALRPCHAKPKRKRRRCEAQAKRHYLAKKTTKKTATTGRGK